MPTRFEHQVAIVTGGAAGIGRAIAERLADDGARIVVADINEKHGHEVAEAIGADRAVFQRLDVTDKSSADAAVAATLARFGRLDIHVNNAGIVNRAPFLEYDLDAWRAVLNVNLTGAFICGQASARAMADAAAVDASSTFPRCPASSAAPDVSPMVHLKQGSSASLRLWRWSWGRTA